MKKHAYAEILKRNPTSKIMIINTIKITGDIYIKLVESGTRTAIMQSNLNFVNQKI
jgi:hypothetical protein